jgi:hypothetical protein
MYKSTQSRRWVWFGDKEWVGGVLMCMKGYGTYLVS